MEDVEESKKESVLDNMIKVELEIPAQYHPYFEYLEHYFNLNMKQYLEFIITKEIESRNQDLHFF